MRKNRRKRIVTLLGCVLLSAACSSRQGNDAQLDGWHDTAYMNAMETAETVFHAGHPSQAEFQYRQALQRALLADQPQAVHDAGFNLALMQLRQGHDADAWQTLTLLDTILRGQHNWQKWDDFSLIRATLLYRQRQWDAARSAARQALVTQDRSVSHQAMALLGLIAFEQNNMPDLQKSIATIQASDDKEDRINLLELQACAALLSQEWQKADDSVASLVRARRRENDYASMRRALQLESRIWRAQGNLARSLAVQKQIEASRQAGEKVFDPAKIAVKAATHSAVDAGREIKKPSLSLPRP